MLEGLAEAGGVWGGGRGGELGEDGGLEFRGVGTGAVLAVWVEGGGRGVWGAVGEEVAEEVEGRDEGFFFEEGEGGGGVRSIGGG